MQKKSPENTFQALIFLLYRKSFFAMIYAYLLNLYEKRLYVC